MASTIAQYVTGGLDLGYRTEGSVNYPLADYIAFYTNPGCFLLIFVMAISRVGVKM